MMDEQDHKLLTELLVNPKLTAWEKKAFADWIDSRAIITGNKRRVIDKTLARIRNVRHTDLRRLENVGMVYFPDHRAWKIALRNGRHIGPPLSEREAELVMRWFNEAIVELRAMVKQQETKKENNPQ